MKSCLSNTGDIWKFIMIVVSESTVEALSLTMLLSLTNMVWEHQCWTNSGKVVLQIFNSPSSCSSAQVLSLISRHNLMSACFDGLNVVSNDNFAKMPFVEFLLNINGNIEARLPFTHDDKPIATCLPFDVWSSNAIILQYYCDYKILSAVTAAILVSIMSYLRWQPQWNTLDKSWRIRSAV